MKHCASIAKRLISLSKTSTVPEAVDAIPKQKNVFRKRYKTAWTFRGKPGSDHAVSTAATFGVDVSGLESYLVSSIREDCMLRKAQYLSVLRVEVL